MRGLLLDIRTHHDPQPGKGIIQVFAVLVLVGGLEQHRPQLAVKNLAQGFQIFKRLALDE